MTIVPLMREHERQYSRWLPARGMIITRRVYRSIKNKVMKIAILSIFCLIFSILVGAQVGWDRLSTRQAYEEIDFYISELENRHVDLYWHTPKRVVDSAVLKVKELIVQNVQQDSVYTGHVLFFLSRMNHFFDYHTGLGASFWAPKDSYVFPEVDCRDGKIFFKGTKTQVISINSLPVSVIINKLTESFGCDYNPKYFEDMVSYIYNFPMGMYECGIKSPYQVETKDESGRDSVMVMDGVDRIMIADRRKELDSGDSRNGILCDKMYGSETHSKASIAIIRYDEVFNREDFPARLGSIDSLLYSFYLRIAGSWA